MKEKKIIPFPQPEEEDEDLVLEDMSPEQLKELLQEFREQLAALDAKEPKNMNSEKYEAWAEEHEDLEDAIDEILDLLGM